MRQICIQALKFQSTRPAWGATRLGRAYGLLHGVSIHAPRVGRDPSPATPSTRSPVSIHAPRVGRDAAASRIDAAVSFQSTRPAWGATVRSGWLHNHVFQSTRPAWGATVRVRRSARSSLRVSIHAPRVGRDVAEHVTAVYVDCFNPRAPRGARPISDAATPRRIVSIHAPRVGRDAYSSRLKGCSFNPRARVGRDLERAD